MRNDSTVFVGLDVHRRSIVAAYAVGDGEVEDLGQVGILQRDLDRYSIRTEQAYLQWIRRYILFHGKRHPESWAALT